MDRTSRRRIEPTPALIRTSFTVIALPLRERTIVLGRTPPLAQFLGEAMFFMKASTTSWILVGLTLLVASAFAPEALRRDTLAVLAPPATTASIPASHHTHT